MAVLTHASDSQLVSYMYVHVCLLVRGCFVFKQSQIKIEWLHTWFGLGFGDLFEINVIVNILVQMCNFKFMQISLSLKLSSLFTTHNCNIK